MAKKTASVRNKKAEGTGKSVTKKVRIRKATGKKMSDMDLKAILRSLQAETEVYQDGGEIAEERRKALRYYRGDRLGNERSGRSSVVSRDALDTVEAALPELIELFCGGDNVAEIECMQPGYEDMAEDMTNYCNYVVNRDNNGFMILYTAIKDAAIQKKGFGKTYWETKEEKTIVRLRDIGFMELAQITDNEDNEIVEQSAYIKTPDESGEGTYDMLVTDEQLEEMTEDEILSQVLYDIKFVHYREKGGHVIDNIPPEEFFITARSKSLDDEPPACGHEREETASTLIRMYPDKKDLIDKVPGFASDVWDSDKTNRYDDETGTGTNYMLDESMRQIKVTEWYAHVDYDGDGVAELRRIVTIGEEIAEILENEEVEDNCFFDFEMVPEPHKFTGQSLVDLVIEIQDIKTTILRQILDNMYQANNKRYWLLDGQVNYNDWLDGRPNSAVRVKSANAIGEIPQGSLSGEGLNVMQTLDVIMERRSGVYRQSRGLDMDRLHDTAEGVNKLIDKMDKRLMLIARILAETGMKRLFKLIIQDAKRYITDERDIQVAGEWVKVDPRKWDLDFNFNIKVGLGTGSLAETIMRSKETLEMLGALKSQYPGMVPEDKAYNAFEDYLKAGGNKNPSRYITSPESEEYQPPEPQPSEEIQKAKMQEETKRMKIDKEDEFNRKKLATETQLAKKRMTLEVVSKTNMKDQEMGGSVAQ